MWKIFIALFVLMPSYARARLHATNGMMLHGNLGGSNSAGSSSPLSKEQHVKTKDIDAVEGKSVSLPCPISAPLNDVYMVLWFRDNAGIPLYSFDTRDKMSSEQPRHWSAPEVFGSRAKFHIDADPPILEIKDIKRHDQGIYRCRIDFRTSQTQSFRFNLSVIILPETPIILDRWGRQTNGTKLGPKQEGDDIVITCRVVGGRPQPEVRWLVNGLLVDNQYEHNSGDVIENRLLWPSVQRNDLNSVFTCQAENTQLDKPKEKSFLLDMHLKPLTVKILQQPSSMVADRRYEVVCESTGSRPNAIITWYKGKRQLRRTKDDISKNTTRSELSFVPTTDDDGKSITCRAENPTVNGLFLETQWKLNVVYPPLVTLRLGSTLSADDIKEGDDVYFECHVQSNPQWRKLLWLHNGIHLEHNTSARVIRSNQSLVLQKITKHYAGNYACSAINDEGETVSNQLPLRVKYTPVCKHMDRVILIGASKDETVEVACEIQADPPPRTFRWKFNNSGETIDMGSERFSINGSRSLLKYTPITDQDYGTLSCWASNEVGTQNQPCLFQVVLAVLPNAVANCTIFNRTELSVDIQCIPGYDGGLPQVFVLEMYSLRTGITRFNLTNPEEPMFSLENLDTLTTLMTQENNSLKMRIYAFNQKGRSPSYAIHDFIIGSNRYRGDDDLPLTLSPVIVGSVLTIVIISLAIAIRIFMVTFLHNLRRQRQHGAKATVVGGVGSTQTVDVYTNSKKSGNTEKPRWQHTDIKTKSSEDLMEDERDPDVIPSQYVGSGNGASIGSAGSTSGNSRASEDLHFPPMTTSKRSPNSNNASTYDTALQQASGNCSANGNAVSGITTASTTITYNQNHARAHMMTAPTTPTTTVSNTNTTNLSTTSPISAGKITPTTPMTMTTPTTGSISSMISPSATVKTIKANTASVMYATGADYEMGALKTTPTAAAAATTTNNKIKGLATTEVTHYNHIQQQREKKYKHGGTLPPGLGSGGGYILNSIINSTLPTTIGGGGGGSGGIHIADNTNFNVANNLLHNSNSSISRALLQQHQHQQYQLQQNNKQQQQQQHYHHQQQQQQQQQYQSNNPFHYDTSGGAKLTSRTGLSGLVGGLHHMPPIYSTLHGSSTNSSSASLNVSGAGGGSSSMIHSNSGSGLGEYFVRNNGANGGLLPTTAETSCNSSSDLDDSITINAIKDCLMAQHVPESCV